MSTKNLRVTLKWKIHPLNPSDRSPLRTLFSLLLHILSCGSFYHKSTTIFWSTYIFFISPLSTKYYTSPYYISYYVCPNLTGRLFVGGRSISQSFLTFEAPPAFLFSLLVSYMSFLRMLLLVFVGLTLLTDVISFDTAMWWIHCRLYSSSQCELQSWFYIRNLTGYILTFGAVSTILTHGTRLILLCISMWQGFLKICQLPSGPSYDNYWPVQKVGFSFRISDIACHFMHWSKFIMYILTRDIFLFVRCHWRALPIKSPTLPRRIYTQ